MTGLGAAGVPGPGITPSVAEHWLGSCVPMLGSGSDCGSDSAKTAPVEQNLMFDDCWCCLVAAAQDGVESEILKQRC